MKPTPRGNYGISDDTLLTPAASPAELEVLSLASAKIDFPLVAIGAVNPENVAPLIAAGADILALISGLNCAAEEAEHRIQVDDFSEKVQASSRKLNALFSYFEPDSIPRPWP